jgi:hypothetical protein|tara:strand:+ start:616 stop:981 length:366 start_codon:yes stop_codon:yes gene_type:complete
MFLGPAFGCHICMKTPPETNQCPEGRSFVPETLAPVPGETFQAVLRTGALPARFAIKAARRAPRAHGMTVSVFAAVSTTDLMKRGFFFMARFLFGHAGIVGFTIAVQSGRFLTVDEKLAQI